MICQHECEPAHIVFCFLFGVFCILTCPPLRAQKGPETRIEGKKPIKNQELIASEDKNTAQPVLSLNRLQGTVISRMGGPLSPSQTLIQGFSGNRTGISWNGFNLADPSGDFTDLNNLPLFIAQKVTVNPNESPALGAALNFNSTQAPSKQWQFQFLSGPQDTQRASMTWVQPLSSELNSMTSVQAGTTQGNFSFQPKGTDSKEQREVRLNNDQKRQTLFQWLTYGTQSLKQNFLLLYHNHEGGIPGFAANPFPTLRGQTQSFLLGSKTRWPRLLPGLALQLQWRQQRRSSYDAATPLFKDTLNSDAYNWALSFKRAFSPLQLFFKAAPEFHINTIQDTVVSRRGFQIPIILKQVLGENLFHWKVWQTLIGEENFDLQPTFGAQIGSALLPDTHINIGARQKARIPSLVEMYAPNGFVLGNPDLAPEKTQDYFANLHFNKNKFGFAASFLYAQSEELIFYVNRNAYELFPINTGETTRTSFSLKGYVQAHDAVFLQGGYDAFETEVKATQAPLPGIPPHNWWGRVSIGPTDQTRLNIQHYYRSETTGDLFGALKVEPYHLTNIQIVHPIDTGLVAFLNLDNLFDVGHARDLYFLPLPGRQIFISFEVVL
jgi:hypothetical protein